MDALVDGIESRSIVRAIHVRISQQEIDTVSCQKNDPNRNQAECFGDYVFGQGTPLPRPAEEGHAPPGKLDHIQRDDPPEKCPPDGCKLEWTGAQIDDPRA